MIALALGMACLAFVLPMPTQRAGAQQEQSLVVIVHPGVPAASLSREALQNVFMRRQLEWPDGTKCIPVNYEAGNPLRVAFDRSVLGLAPEQAARYWIDARIRSATEAPRAVPSPRLLARVVPKLRGSIGYLPADQAPSDARIVARIEQGRVRTP